MTSLESVLASFAMFLAVTPALPADTTRPSQEIPVDLSGYSPDCGVEVRRDGSHIVLAWPMEGGESGVLTIELSEGRSLVERLALRPSATAEPVRLLERVEPVYFLTVGTRQAPPGRPPQMSVFNTFFDSPAQRPHQTYLSRFQLRKARVTSEGRRATLAIGDVTIGPFEGELQFTVYAGGRLVHMEAVVRTQEDQRAILYDAGLVGGAAGWQAMAWTDTEGQRRRERVDPEVGDRPLAVRYRTLVVESAAGSVACFSPPHQFQFPRDLTDNLGYVWFGRGHEGLRDRFGFGIRQAKSGGGAFVPWFNAPPGTQQRLGVFFLLNRGSAEEAIQEVLRYTRGDRFAKMPGYQTLTSHWHMAVAVTAMQAREKRGSASGPKPPLSPPSQGGEKVPDFVRMFSDMGVNIVHLAEFHGDGHQKDPGPLRLPELEEMFAQCRRLSDGELLFLPGEEVNDFLGIKEPGKHPGHWMSLFPKPVYWVMQRKAEEPLAEAQPRYGTLYRVGGRQDMVELLGREGGLAWAAHPRIKASSWTPDIFRHEDFYLTDVWFGGAWKAMPADLSRPRLGERALDLLDDMANWGQKKYVLGEVDVFKIDHTHELFGHMNVNYVRLDRLPRFDEGWQPVLDALRAGRFFVTTGEVLIRELTVGGKESGETLIVSGGERPQLQVNLEWTFPLRFAEVISGDGRQVYRERIDLADTGPFGQRTLNLTPKLTGRRWVRFEVWDIAANGAFTQPIWLAAEN